MSIITVKTNGEINFTHNTMVYLSDEKLEEMFAPLMEKEIGSVEFIFKSGIIMSDVSDISNISVDNTESLTVNLK